MTHTIIPAAVREALSRFDKRQIFWLLGEILEPSVGEPLLVTDDSQDAFYDALAPIVEAYEKAYDSLYAIINDEGDPDAAYWRGSDERYEMRRDMEDGL